MEKLTLEEAIKYTKEIARANRVEAENYIPTTGPYYNANLECANQYEQISMWLKELKSYKDIGTPKELKELKENGAFTGVELAKLAIIQKELKEYKDLEEQGLLVRLPDDLSRVLYQVNYRWKCTEYGEENDKCEIYDCKCECDIRKEYYIAEVELQCIPIKSYYNCLGEFLFLTREEAEKKLEEMKKNRKTYRNRKKY